MIDLPTLLGVYQWLIIHCSATPPSMDVGSAWIDRVHRKKGWSKCGYHIVIRRDGTIEWAGTGHRTRAIGKAGAHVGGCGPGWNRICLGICMIGGVKEDGRTPQDNFTPEQWAALEAVVREAMRAFGVDDDHVIGHRDLIKMTNAAPKACPCFSVKGWIAGLDWEPANAHATKIRDEYDLGRSLFDWVRSLRPAPQRTEKLVINRRMYIVKPDDTLWSISRTYGVPVHELKRLNGLPNDTIKVGQKLSLVN
ncbi:MAG: LysM peptidoglycan-binding domain-containing protein [Pseudomonadota bacterium]